MEQTPQEIMEQILRKLKQSEKSLEEALGLFDKFPKKSKNGARRMDDLIKALHILVKNQFDIPVDWTESQWWSDDYSEFLTALQNKLRKDS